MAIIIEYYTTRADGVTLNRTYSDKSVKIERDGVLYDEAIDPAELDRKYIETVEPVDGDISEADYQNALREMGVKV